MQELSNKELNQVSAGVDVSDMAASAFSGALAGGTFGAAVGGSLGLLPGALVIGGLGAGIGFISGLASYAFNP